jgi:hypothetical protein
MRRLHRLLSQPGGFSAVMPGLSGQATVKGLLGIQVK